MSAQHNGAVAEWRRYWPLPVAAGFGYATSVIHIYGLGPYIEPVQETFGWSRTQTTIGLTIATIVNAAFGVPIGMLIDRFGPRIIGMIGIALTCAAFALLSTSDGSASNWYLLWGLLAFATLPVQATVWTGAVTSRFSASRGLALAVTLCGASLAAFVFPRLAAQLIADHGWRNAFLYQAIIWVLIAFPMIALFFRGARDGKTKTVDAEKQAATVLTGASIKQALRTGAFYQLFIASLLFTFTILALVVHFVPILTDSGADRLAAASVASLVGVFSIVGRLGTGFLLDRFRASYVGAVIFVLPILACLLLLYAGGNVQAQLVAAAIIGLTLGSEVDVIVYLTARHFGLKHFGALYGAMLTALSIGAAFGPLAAASVYDSDNSYAAFLWLTIAIMAVSSLAIGSLSQPAYAAGAAIDAESSERGP